MPTEVSTSQEQIIPNFRLIPSLKKVKKAGTADLNSRATDNSEEIERKEELKAKVI